MGITWDSISPVPKTSSDTGIGVDAILTISAAVVNADTGAGADALSESLSSRSESDTGAGVEALIDLLKSIAKFSSDTGAGAESILSRLLASSDTGAGAESILSRLLTSFDLGIGRDAVLEIVDVLLEEGVSIEFSNFIEDFSRFVARYGRTLLNHNTDERFDAVFKILSGTKCLGDNRMMECGDAIAYVLPSFKFEIGDVVSPVLGRGIYTIVAERYASRIGNLRIFRTLGLERYTPGDALAGTYDITLPIAVELESSYNISSKEIRKEMVSKYDITKTPAQIVGERAVATGAVIDNYWNPWNDEDLMSYKVHRSLNTGFTPSDANLVGVATSNSFKHSNLAALTQYYFKVCAVSKLGVSGSYSVQFTATTG
jgi:hypothetical protein